MNKVRARWAALGMLVVGASVALAESRGPIPGMTGAPGENLCNLCHDEFTLNSGGTVALVNAPPYYKGGSTYTITVSVASTHTVADVDREWGFELTAVNAGGTGAGTFATIDGQGTKLVAGEGALASRTYVEHDGTGNRTGVASPALWEFQWTAPPTGSGPVTFHLAGLAANGDHNMSGDWVYHTSLVMDDSSTAVSPTSWGALKHSYR